MAEQLLDDPQVGAAVEQVRREGVAERVRRHAVGQAGPAAQEVEPVAQAADAERRAAVVQEDLGGLVLAGRAQRPGGPAGRPRDRRSSDLRAGRPSSPTRSLRPLPSTRISPRRSSSDARSAAASSLIRSPAA